MGCDTPDCCRRLGTQQVVSPRTLLSAHQEREKQAMASRGPLPPATATLLKHAHLHPPAPAGIFVPQNLTIAVAHITLISTPSFLSFGDSCPSTQK